MTQTIAPKPTPPEHHPLIRIANLEAQMIQLEHRLAKLESLQVSTPSPLPPTTSRSEEDSDNAHVFEIVSIDTRLVEANDTWSKIAWKLVLKNLTDTRIVFHASIEFLDKDGFLVDDAFEPNLVLSARNEQVFTNTTLIDAALIGNVSSIQAKVKIA